MNYKNVFRALPGSAKTKYSIVAGKKWFQSQIYKNQMFSFEQIYLGYFSFPQASSLNGS